MYLEAANHWSAANSFKRQVSQARRCRNRRCTSLQPSDLSTAKLRWYSRWDRSVSGTAKPRVCGRGEGVEQPAGEQLTQQAGVGSESNLVKRSVCHTGDPADGLPSAGVLIWVVGSQRASWSGTRLLEQAAAARRRTLERFLKGRAVARERVSGCWVHFGPSES
jgi:hypothetical protein